MIIYALKQNHKEQLIAKVNHMFATVSIGWPAPNTRYSENPLSVMLYASGNTQ